MQAVASRHSADLSASESPEFAEVLRELPPEAYVNRLRRYLNMPVERIPRYKLHLQELLGCTPPEHVDFVPLQSSIQSLDWVVNKEISEIHENTRTLVSVSAKVGMDLSGRHFVRDGMLHKVCRSKVQLYYFVLLENGGLYKKKFHLLDLWKCKVEDDVTILPGVLTPVTTSNNKNGSPTTSSTRSKKFRRLWITLTLQTISLESTFKTTQPEETVPIELCLVVSLKNETWFRLQFPSDLKLCTQTTYVFESLSQEERDEWVRALKHCISGGDELALRRRSLKTATLAPIFMLDKISNVCTICTQTFIVYRARHHCR
ncbi:hypothetical protein PsorP6_000489 [Peronosclerospora sorghi]|uniref:Uncharacterized protein n=1 Tax=Peronosclerospora sorghi TaxID=230839 RepID=A0ACC0WW02_9STRA|nr:hypothetical protein PsorP6_000489 [Peronosclerospora sorghi]